MYQFRTIFMTVAGTVLLVALIAQPLGAVAQGTPEASPASGDTGVIAYALPGDEVYPEGVTFDASANVFYVGSTTDGTIFRGDIDAGDVEVFAEGGSDARGMDIADGRLYVAGGPTGQLFVYDLETGETLETVSNGLSEGTFMNDVVVVDGAAYVTDSFNPTLWRVTFEGAEPTIEPFIDFTDTPFVYEEEGFNANGIVATPDGQYLLIVQSATGRLFRVDVATSAIDQVAVGAAVLRSGDGLALNGQLLYAVLNADGLIIPIDLDADYRGGTAGEPISLEEFAFPTTMALTGDGRALVVNSQFNTRESGDPELPFTVINVPLPDVDAGPATPESSPVS